MIQRSLLSSVKKVMGWSASSGLALWLLFLASVGSVMAKADTVNKSSSGGLFWSTAKEEGDLMRMSETQETTVGVDDDADLDGGFSSLDGMLQWAIGIRCFSFSPIGVYAFCDSDFWTSSILDNLRSCGSGYQTLPNIWLRF